MHISSFVWYLIALFVISIVVLPKQMKKNKQEKQEFENYYIGEREEKYTQILQTIL